MALPTPRRGYLTGEKVVATWWRSESTCA